MDVAAHPTRSSLCATTGTDGSVYIWHISEKYHQLVRKIKLAVEDGDSSDALRAWRCSFSNDGTMLAVSTAGVVGSGAAETVDALPYSMPPVEGSAVVVVDVSGRTIVAKTMIGASGLTGDFALAKANVCIGMHCSSREFRDKYQNGDGIGPKMPQLLGMGTAAAAANRPLAAFPGGVMCRDAAGNLVGAIGVSGAASDEDEHCAISGAQAVGLVTDPAASQLK